LGFRILEEAIMEITKEMLERHNAAQKAAQDVMNALDNMTIVEAVGILELVKQGMLSYAHEDYDLPNMGGVH
jgi:hypothetical protein